MNVVSFAMFVLSLVYNIVRAAMLAKTKTLELHQDAIGLPTAFTLSGIWRWVFFVSNYGTYVNLIIVAIHSWHFLNQRVAILAPG